MRNSILFVLGLVSSACATNYQPGGQSGARKGLLGFSQSQAPSQTPQAPSLGMDDAEIALIRTLKQAGWYSKPEYAFDEGYEEIATGSSSVRFVHRGQNETERWSCPYANTPAPNVKEFGFPEVRYGWRLFLGGCAAGSGTVRLEWRQSRGESAHQFADALFALAHGGAVDPAADPEFQKTVQQHRAAGGGVQLPEEARAHRVAAEEAVKEKRFEDAANEYGEALKLAPGWPQGHFNRALILAELGAYGAATRGMKRYLLLEPDAENARQVQDKIYAWQAKVK